ncbi:MAG: hypothetical protein J6D47_21480 [Peptostreptococcaceae bacterium]|nr:hypothetical protein [Peptostreptococcaceae bacterium]
MNKGLETLKLIVENNIKSSTKEIERYLNMETPEIWVGSISYFEGIKSISESLLKAIEHEIKMYEIEQQADFELDMFLMDDGLPISMAERI